MQLVRLGMGFDPKIDLIRLQDYRRSFIVIMAMAMRGAVRVYVCEISIS